MDSLATALGADLPQGASEIARDLGNRYMLMNFIGRGAYASVWRAYDRISMNSIAIKRFEAMSIGRRDFYQEMRWLLLLDHPGIVKLYNLFETPTGSRYLVLEFCGGGTLRRALNRASVSQQTCSSERTVQLVRQMAEGLAAAHAANAIHRDLKPDNVLFAVPRPGNFCGESPVKIADFGLARPHVDGSSDGVLGGLTGSPAYMAPEQFMGQFGPASDVYALGVIAYELLTGQVPFRGGPEEAARQHLYSAPELSAAWPAPWPELIAALLDKKPNARPTAQQVVERLLEARSNPVTEKPNKRISDDQALVNVMKALAEFVGVARAQPLMPENMAPSAAWVPMHEGQADEDAPPVDAFFDRFDWQGGVSAPPPAEPPSPPAAPAVEAVASPMEEAMAFPPDTSDTPSEAPSPQVDAPASLNTSQGTSDAILGAFQWD